MAIVGRVSRTVTAVDGVDWFDTEAEGVGDEKTVVCSGISLAESIFAFFPFLEGAGDCGVVANIVGFVWAKTDVVVAV